MEGTAQPTGQWLPRRHLRLQPGGHAARLRPGRREALLAEAGYPQGFRMTLHSPNDRYPNDSKTAQAVAQMWSRIGMRTEVEAVPWASFSQRSNRQEYRHPPDRLGQVDRRGELRAGQHPRHLRPGEADRRQQCRAAIPTRTGCADRPRRGHDRRHGAGAAAAAGGEAGDGRCRHHPAVPAGQQLGAAARPDLRARGWTSAPRRWRCGRQVGRRGAAATAPPIPPVAGATGRMEVSFTVAIASSVSTRCTPGRLRSSSFRKAVERRHVGQPQLQQIGPGAGDGMAFQHRLLPPHRLAEGGVVAARRHRASTCASSGQPAGPGRGRRASRG